jgi:hypothetical protein
MTSRGSRSARRRAAVSRLGASKRAPDPSGVGRRKLGDPRRHARPADRDEQRIDGQPAERRDGRPESCGQLAQDQLQGVAGAVRGGTADR